MTDRGAKVLVVLVALVAAAACVIPAEWNDLARLTGGTFFSDGATYYAMAHSLAADLDLEYTPADLARVRREYPGGPGGIFLKRTAGGLTFGGGRPERERPIYFGKAMTYPVIAAPFVRAAGTRGFLALNVLCLVVAWAFAAWMLREQGASPGVALAAAASLVGATIAPIYVFWIQPEVLNLALILAALVAWRRGRIGLSIVLFGVAVYTKPTHAFMAGPLVLAPLLDGSRAWLARGRDAAVRAVLVIGVGALGFLANQVVTGEWNYQGGERKTFNGAYPFDRLDRGDVTFGNSGEWMTTMKLGPLSEDEVEGGGTPAVGQGIAQADEELRQMFVANVGYFWFGRYAGMLPYFAPAFVALVAFVVLGPRTAAGGAAVASLLIYFLVSIWLLPGPTNWYGGGGTVGNRYFTSVLPLAALFVPRGREIAVALAGALIGAAFIGPALASPVAHSLSPARLAAASSTLPWLPIERTMLNDLSLNTDAWRKKQAYDDAEGDPPLHRPGSHNGYWLYFPDDGTFGREPLPGLTLRDGEPAEGFRVKRGRPTEILLRANEPVDQIVVTLRSAGSPDEIAIDTGAQTERRQVAPGSDVIFEVVPGGSVMFYDSFVYVVRLRSLTPAANSPDRSQHTLVRFALKVTPRPRR